MMILLSLVSKTQYVAIFERMNGAFSLEVNESLHELGGQIATSERAGRVLHSNRRLKSII